MKDDLSERIGFVERALENYREYKTSIEDLETDVMHIKNRLESLEIRARPHKCPVCDGVGNITKEIHPKLAEFERLPTCLSIACKSCDGKGIVWG